MAGSFVAQGARILFSKAFSTGREDRRNSSEVISTNIENAERLWIRCYAGPRQTRS